MHQRGTRGSKLCLGRTVSWLLARRAMHGQPAEVLHTHCACSYRQPRRPEPRSVCKHSLGKLETPPSRCLWCAGGPWRGEPGAAAADLPGALRGALPLRRARCRGGGGRRHPHRVPGRAAARAAPPRHARARRGPAHEEVVSFRVSGSRWVCLLRSLAQGDKWLRAMWVLRPGARSCQPAVVDTTASTGNCKSLAKATFQLRPLGSAVIFKDSRTSCRYHCN